MCPGRRADRRGAFRVGHESRAGPNPLAGFLTGAERRPTFRYARYNSHRRAFETPFWREGWALYWEMLLWDRGFPRSPEDKVGMLFWRMHRAARIMFSLGFHLGRLSPQECIDLLVDKVVHERANAEGEVRRSFNGSYPPLYQLAYMMGGLQFKAMHKELVASGKMTDRAFHETRWVDRTCRQIEQAPPFPDVPLAVVTAAPRPPSRTTPAEVTELRLANQEKLIALSQTSRQFHAAGSGHFPQLSEPNVVVDAVRWVLEQLPHDVVDPIELGRRQPIAIQSVG